MDKTVARKRGGGCGSVLLIWGKGKHRIYINGCMIFGFKTTCAFSAYYH